MKANILIGAVAAIGAYFLFRKNPQFAKPAIPTDRPKIPNDFDIFSNTLYV